MRARARSSISTCSPSRATRTTSSSASVVPVRTTVIPTRARRCRRRASAPLYVASIAARLDMKTYDLHQHLWPDAFIGALRARTEPPHLVGHELVTAEGSFPVDLDA